MVAFLIAGPGYLDGSDIVETVSASIAFGEKGYKILYFTPEGNQEETVNHVDKKADVNEIRDFSVEAARVIRGPSQKIANLRADTFKALFIPGGAAVTKVFSNFDESKSKFTVNENIAKIIKEFHDIKKPILAIDNAPLLLAKVLGKDNNLKVTLGSNIDKDYEKVLEESGTRHQNREHTDVCVDEDNSVFTSPAYAGRNPGVHEVHAGIKKLLDTVLDSGVMGAKRSSGAAGEKKMTQEERLAEMKRKAVEDYEKQKAKNAAKEQK